MRALEFIRDHVTFKLPYDFSYHMKTPLKACQLSPCNYKKLVTWGGRVNSQEKSMTSFMDEPSSWWPIKAERPETVQALAMAKPPPRSRTNDHGIFLWMTCQFKRAGEGCDEVTAI